MHFYRQGILSRSNNLAKLENSPRGIFCTNFSQYKTRVASITTPNTVEFFSLEDFIAHPPERTEWVDGKLVEKTGMTFKHGLAQGKLFYYFLL